MNMESMRIRSYRSFKVDEHVPAVAAGRYRTLKAYDRLRAAGCNESGALEQPGSAGARCTGGRPRLRRSRPAPAVSASGPGSPGTSRR